MKAKLLNHAFDESVNIISWHKFQVLTKSVWIRLQQYIRESEFWRTNCKKQIQQQQNTCLIAESKKISSAMRNVDDKSFVWVAFLEAKWVFLEEKKEMEVAVKIKIKWNFESHQNNIYNEMQRELFIHPIIKFRLFKGAAVLHFLFVFICKQQGGATKIIIIELTW